MSNKHLGENGPCSDKTKYYILIEILFDPFFFLYVNTFVILLIFYSNEWVLNKSKYMYTAL